MTTWRELLADASERLGQPLDARRIVEEASGLEPAELVVALDDHAPPLALTRTGAMIERRAAGEPLQYVLGRWGFRTLDLMVDRRVLIPRPETEVVAGVAIDEARRVAAKKEGNVTVVDLGTGAGGIALAIASEVPRARVWATDESADALEVAGANLAGLGGFAATRVRLRQGSWFDALPDEMRGAIDVMVSNPPYVADAEVLPEEVERWEPRGALRAGPTGLECLSALIADAAKWLARPGTLVLELAPNQAAAVQAQSTAAGFVDVRVLHDLAGRGRALRARLP